MLNALDNKKTLLAVFVLFVAGGLKALGTIDEQTFDIVRTLAEGLGFAGVWHKLHRNSVK